MTAAELDAEIAAMRAIRVEEEVAEFGVLENARTEVARWLEVLADRVLRMAVVETAAAKTSVGWGGDWESCWRPSREETTAHWRVVSTALAERYRYLEALAVATGVAAAIAQAMVMPMGAPGALRAAIRLEGSLRALVER
jgi:hypothetical protein